MLIFLGLENWIFSKQKLSERSYISAEFGRSPRAKSASDVRRAESSHSVQISFLWNRQTGAPIGKCKVFEALPCLKRAREGDLFHNFDKVAAICQDGKKILE
jgi:hypothetical protein